MRLFAAFSAAASLLSASLSMVIVGRTTGLVAAILFLLAGALIVWRATRRPRARASGASIEADTAGLWRTTSDARTPIIDWDRPFGVTLLASYGRPQALLAFTSPTRTRYVPVRIDERSESDDELLARVAILADLDLVDGVAHDAALTTADASAVVRFVAQKNDRALSRIYLSDGKGVPIWMDRGTLSVAGKTFDLMSGLEWRALMFHESAGQGAALYQATAIRQGTSEVVLVAPMPASIVPREANAHREASGRLGRALTRDLKLLQAPVESPPPREVRVAIDRPFMIAIRHVLDEAPLALRIVPEPAARQRAQRRDAV